MAGDPAMASADRPPAFLFQSAPAIDGGRSRVCDLDERDPCRFNPRPPSMAGDPRCRSWACGAGCCFNPRPPSMAGDPPAPDPGKLPERVFQSAPAIDGGRSIQNPNSFASPVVFQSAPAIDGGRSRDFRHRANRLQRFQSAPAIDGGRSVGRSPPSAILRCFNPRPPSMAGDPADDDDFTRRCIVSIRARHRWRAIPPVPQVLPPLFKFQSAPAIDGGRSRGLAPHLGRHGCFNPRPPSMAGDPEMFAQLGEHEVVSIRARHRWRAILAGSNTLLVAQSFQSAPAIDGGRSTVCPGTQGREAVSIRARHRWRAIPVRSNHVRALGLFQSAPAIDGGRSPRSGPHGAASIRFNPRPPSMAGDPLRAQFIVEQSHF